MYVCVCVFVHGMQSNEATASLCRLLLQFLTVRMCMYVSVCLCACVSLYVTCTARVQQQRSVGCYSESWLYVCVSVSACACVCVCVCAWHAERGSNSSATQADTGLRIQRPCHVWNEAAPDLKKYRGFLELASGATRYLFRGFFSLKRGLICITLFVLVQKRCNDEIRQLIALRNVEEFWNWRQVRLDIFSEAFFPWKEALFV